MSFSSWQVHQPLSAAACCWIGAYKSGRSRVRKQVDRQTVVRAFSQVDGRMKMIKLNILMVRRGDFTYDKFIQYWREVHAPLFAAQSESKKYVRRYVQEHRTRDALPGTTASNFDGIAEIWFDDISGAKAFFESDGYQKNVIPDEESFMDRKRCELLYTHEYNVIG
jgi:uncharacterized protein (TIGR02118 family)